MTAQAKLPVRTWAVDFVLLAAIWGASFMFMHVATVEFGPLPTAALRVGIATLALLGGCAGHPNTAADTPIDVSLIAFNDLHGNLQPPGEWSVRIGVAKHAVSVNEDAVSVDGATREVLTPEAVSKLYGIPVAALCDPQGRIAGFHPV